MGAEKTLIDEILENTIKFIDSAGTEIKLEAKATRRQYAPNATDAEWEQFVDTIQATGLDPRRKEVYFTKYKTKDGDFKVSIVTGYQVYLARALKSGKLAKIPEIRVVKPNDKDIMTWYGEVDITRKDMEGTATWKTPMKEANKSQALWNIMPEFMLKKTAGPQGLRIYLADVIGGLPYTIEEIASGISESEPSEFTEGDVEPTDVEKEKLDKAKRDAIDSVKTKIDDCQTVAELDSWVKKQKNLESSKIKKEIEEMIALRRMAIGVETIAKIMNLEMGLVFDFIDTAKLEETVIKDVMAGDADSIEELAKMINNFKNERDNQIIDEDAELDLLADERSQEHNPPM